MRRPSSARTVSHISFVLDASAAVKAVKLEARSDEYAAWLHVAQRRNHPLLAPHLLRYELGSILAGIPADPTVRARHLHEGLLGVTFADGSTAFEHAPPLSYYDAAYLSLAESSKSTLVSYDGKLLAAAKKAGIPTLSP